GGQDDIRKPGRQGGNLSHWIRRQRRLDGESQTRPVLPFHLRWNPDGGRHQDEKGPAADTDVEWRALARGESAQQSRLCGHDSEGVGLPWMHRGVRAGVRKEVKLLSRLRKLVFSSPATG